MCACYNRPVEVKGSWVLPFYHVGSKDFSGPTGGGDCPPPWTEAKEPYFIYFPYIVFAAIWYFPLGSLKMCGQKVEAEPHIVFGFFLEVLGLVAHSLTNAGGSSFFRPGCLRYWLPEIEFTLFLSVFFCNDSHQSLWHLVGIVFIN